MCCELPTRRPIRKSIRSHQASRKVSVFPQVRVVVTTSLGSGCIVHYNTAKVEGKRTGEVSLFREKHGDFVSGDVVVADANRESFHDAALLKRRGVHMVCCINGTRNSPFEGVCKLIEEKTVTVRKPSFQSSRFTREEWEALPDTIRYRVIRYRLHGRKSEITIVTTLADRKRFPAEDYRPTLWSAMGRGNRHLFLQINDGNV